MTLSEVSEREAFHNLSDAVIVVCKTLLKLLQLSPDTILRENRHGVLAQHGHLLSVRSGYFAAQGREAAAEDIHHGAFTGSVAAQKGVQFTFFDRQRSSAQYKGSVLLVTKPDILSGQDIISLADPAAGVIRFVRCAEAFWICRDS